ncbi:hypothetical protein K443DRAFT_365652 [Laccaria amethystina LaAM-08-1]|uniref:Uncharacterized protein n=1 Tax=Laccaria amethystina LaAM-08-1 TaxID=1095629 RepID=A0A0C9WYZ4_9AGAR|nr:hypothetical protein K443DRAFT_365652 [Laccaria amethystina LaAM-08-1]
MLVVGVVNSLPHSDYIWRYQPTRPYKSALVVKISGTDAGGNPNMTRNRLARHDAENVRGPTEYSVGTASNKRNARIPQTTFIELEAASQDRRLTLRDFQRGTC